MKRISLIETIRTKYRERFIGDQKEIENTPFRFISGVLTTKGEIENGDPKFRVVTGGVVSLVANTNSQLVLSAKNLYHDRALFIIKAGASTTSYDWSLKVDFRGLGIRTLGDGRGNTIYFQDIIATNQPRYEMFNNLPYGEDVDIIIHADNNHLSTAISIQAWLLFLGPVR